MRARTAAKTLRPAVYIHEATITGMNAHALSHAWFGAVVTPCVVQGKDGHHVVYRATEDKRKGFEGCGSSLVSLRIYRRYEDG